MNAEASRYKPPFVLSLDTGNTSVKATLYDSLPESGYTYNPNPQRTLVYLNGIQSQRRLYDALIGDGADS